MCCSISILEKILYKLSKASIVRVCLDKFPSTVQAYLQESGFSVAEILIITHLIEDGTLTVRMLCAKTGKSVGVIDRAVKKLRGRGLIRREVINGVPKYLVGTISSIRQWMHNESRERKEMINRKQHDFEVFLSSLKEELCRPELEHFEGESAIEDMYMQVLIMSVDQKEVLHYLPITSEGEDHQMLKYRSMFDKIRKNNGIFSRVITQDTAEGRKIKSKDHLRNRMTLIVPAQRFPVTFEKIITKDAIACFSCSENKATILHYPELAEEERKTFSTLWNHLELTSLKTNCIPVPSVNKGGRFRKIANGWIKEKRGISVLALCILIVVIVGYGI